MAKAEAKQNEKELTPQEELQLKLDSLSPSERLDWLDLHAHSVKEEEYRAPLSEGELDEVKTKIARLAIQMQELEDEKQRFMDEWKLKMKPVEVMNEEVVREARSQERVGYGKVWYVANEDAKTTIKIAEGNVLVGSRPSTKEELEKRLFVS